jgi:pimeloyl-ACP methyl ester carboxylesterase
MRLFEMILSISLILWLFPYLVNVREMKKQWLKFALFSTAVVAIHIVFEGIRLQMILLYLLYVFLVVLVILRKKKSPEMKKPHPRVSKRIAIGALAGIYLIIALLLPVVIPIFELPKPTGPYAVGSDSRYLVDENRPEPFVDTVEYREMMIQLFYPVETYKDRKKKYGQFPYREWSSALSAFFSIPKIFFHHIKYVNSYVVENSSLITAPEKLPVLFFSHGAGGSRFQNFALMRELASHGYLIVSIDHTYDAGEVIFPDKRIQSVYIGLSQDDFDHDSNILIRAEDAIFVLDQLYQFNENDPDGVLTNRLDLERVGFAGHSYGGATAAQTIALDSRFKAGINFDGALFGTSVEIGLDRPFMLFHAESSFRSELSDKQLEAVGMSREEFEIMMEDTFNKAHTMFNESIRDDAYFLQLGYGDHMSFSDVFFLSPLLSHGYNLYEFHECMNEITLSFFDKYIKGNDVISIQNVAGNMCGISLEKRVTMK